MVTQKVWSAVLVMAMAGIVAAPAYGVAPGKSVPAVSAAPDGAAAPPICPEAILGPNVQAGSIGVDFEDVYCFVGVPRLTVRFSVDTVAAATTGDLWACVAVSLSHAGCVIGGDAGDPGDDGMPCTFPPPAFACPNMAGALPLGLPVYYLIIGAFTDNSAPVVEYEATLEALLGPAGRTPLGMVLVADDQPQTGF